MPRLAIQVGGDLTRQKEAAALLLLGPGTPFIYYGEEIGMSGDKPDEQIRTPMRWDRSEPARGLLDRHAVGATLRGSGTPSTWPMNRPTQGRCSTGTAS